MDFFDEGVQAAMDFRLTSITGVRHVGGKPVWNCSPLVLTLDHLQSFALKNFALLAIWVSTIFKIYIDKAD